MEKLSYFFIDDVIWVMRDIARQKPASIFDNAFMSVLKKAHDEYGLTVQLNLFYRTDFFYSSDEFNLTQMPDCYKSQFEANNDWLRFAFHAKQEFPDYPYINATYEDVKADYYAIYNEVVRFAGAGSWSYAVVPHWLPISKAGCQALADCGVKFISPSKGEKLEYTGADGELPDHLAARLLQNRQPETGIYGRKKLTNGKTIFIPSLAGHNHVSQELMDSLFGRNCSYLDEETGMRFRNIGGGPCINNNTQESIRERLAQLNGNEYIGVGNHEQYFYKEYFKYIPDIADRIYLMAELLDGYGYRFITADEMK